MAQGKQTPRQKMINLMYLVFIAMLAMQIDQEIIRSYNDTNQTLTSTRKLVETKNDDIFAKTLEAKAASSPETFAQANQVYGQLKVQADAIVGYIDGLKGTLKKESGYVEGLEDVQDNFAALNNTEPSSGLFFKDSDENTPSKESQELMKKIAEYRNFVNTNLKALPDMEEVVKRANKNLVTEFPNGKNKNGKTWLQYKFYGQPLIAALSNLEVLQSEVRNVQSDAIVMMLQEKVDADIKFNAFEAIVAGPTVVLQGEPAEAKVVIGSYASTVPGLSITGVDRTENGMGYKKLNTGGIGAQTFGGKITFQNAKGETVELPYTHTYNVIAGAETVAFESGALLSADKMQVLYRGLPNPISGSILGADNSKTTLSATGATVAKNGNGKWTVTPGAGAETTLTISGKGPKGQSISQAFKFRIKGLPTAVGQIRGENIVSMPASSIPNQTVSVAMPDFDWPVSFTVNSFMFKVPGKAAMTVNGNSLSGAASLVKNLRAGDIAYVYNINASASGIGNQSLKKIPAVVINVQ
ncbi:MAG: gliding motility protein GldM [Bergeyella sp.]